MFKITAKEQKLIEHRRKIKAEGLDLDEIRENALGLAKDIEKSLHFDNFEEFIIDFDENKKPSKEERVLANEIYAVWDALDSVTDALYKIAKNKKVPIKKDKLII